MASPEEFARRIATLAAELEQGVTVTVRKAALAADQAVVMGTPVDTGRARANWVVSIGVPFLETKPEPASPGQGASDSIQQALGAVGPYQLGMGPIYISNNLPYIGRLNEGYSKQAPANFVEKAVIAGISAVKGARVL